MCEAEAILDRARSLGLTLSVEGDRIAIEPARLCPPDFIATMREKKPAIISLLEARTANLSPDCRPWVHVARHVILGEWNGATKSEWESVEIGLRGIDHPQCKHAVAICRQALIGIKRKNSNT